MDLHYQWPRRILPDQRNAIFPHTTFCLATSPQISPWQPTANPQYKHINLSAIRWAKMSQYKPHQRWMQQGRGGSIHRQRRCSWVTLAIQNVDELNAGVNDWKRYIYLCSRNRNSSRNQLHLSVVHFRTERNRGVTCFTCAWFSIWYMCMWSASEITHHWQICTQVFLFDYMFLDWGAALLRSFGKE